MCSLLKVKRNTYYWWLNRSPCKREMENKEIVEKIIVIHSESRQCYGSPRITKVLNNKSIKVSRPRVARLMKKANIRSKIKRKFKVTTDSTHQLPVAENILNRNFQPAIPGTAWVSDITYVRTIQGWLYLTAIIDLADRKVIGWSLSENMKASSTSIPAFEMAVKNRPVETELIFHSDRGIQYACAEFMSYLDLNENIIQSMSRKGNCWDNAVAESFFKTVKVELIYEKKFLTIQQAKTEIFEYIEIWYNRKRLHSSIGYRTPEEMEKYLQQKKLVA
jgi:putative transposase